MVPRMVKVRGWERWRALCTIAAASGLLLQHACIDNPRRGLESTSEPISRSGPPRILTVGHDGGARATQTWAAGQLGSSVTHVSETTFNDMTASDILAYDVVLTQWASSGTLDLASADIQQYVAAGGGLILDGDYNNFNDLDWAGVSATTTCSGYGRNWSLMTADVVDGNVLGEALPASPDLENCHGAFPTYSTTVFSPFLWDLSGNVAGLAGHSGDGRILVTGPDQDYHADPDTRPEQLQLLLNELRWVSQRRNVYYGLDTNSDPQYVNGLPSNPRFFIGRLGSGSDLDSNGDFTPCSLVHAVSGNDVITGQPSHNPCDFDFEAAELIGPATTYGYWLLRGPRDRLTHKAKLYLDNYASSATITGAHRTAARTYGRQQAEAFIAQLQLYAMYVPRVTVFADLENDNNGGTSGWYTCDPGSLGIIPNVCPATEGLNEIVLEEFFRTLVANSYTPGVYTNVDRWIQYFSTAFIPSDASGAPTPFVTWITSCHALCSYRDDPAGAATNRTASLNAVLGGSRAVIWQYYIPEACRGILQLKDIPHKDVDLTEDDPRDGFTPVLPADLPHPTVNCTAGP